MATKKPELNSNISSDFFPLVIIFTYERPQLLKNAAKSVTEFYPWGDRLIIDDGSVSDEQKAALAFLSSAGWEIKRVVRNRAREYGGFYANMKYGLKLALERGYKYCLFFEDDEQFLWSDRNYPEYILSVFNNAPDCVAILPLLYRRMIDYSDKIEYLESVDAYRTDRGFNTTCLWNLDRVRDLGYQVDDSIGDGLAVNSKFFLERGYRLYGQRSPIAAIIPWVESRKMGAPRIGHKIKDKSFELTPLTPPFISWLRMRSPATLPYQEYLPLSPRNSNRPIWHQAGGSLIRYYELCHQVNKKERLSKQHPCIVSHLSTWILPTRREETHINFGARKDDVRVSRFANSIKIISNKLGLRNYRCYRLIREFKVRHYIGYTLLKIKLRHEVLKVYDEVHTKYH